MLNIGEIFASTVKDPYIIFNKVVIIKIEQFMFEQDCMIRNLKINFDFLFYFPRFFQLKMRDLA